MILGRNVEQDEMVFLLLELFPLLVFEFDFLSAPIPFGLF